LFAEFASGRQDDGLSDKPFEIELFENRDDECGGFSSSRTGLAGAINALQSEWNETRLNRAGRDVLDCGERLQHGGAQPQILKPAWGFLGYLLHKYSSKMCRPLLPASRNGFHLAAEAGWIP